MNKPWIMRHIILAVFAILLFNLSSINCSSNNTEFVDNANYTWDLQQIYSTDVPNTDLNYISMKLDSQGYPHICFAEWNADPEMDINPGYDLHYAYWNESGWQSFVMAFYGDLGRYCSLALDKHDYPHIAYYDATKENLNLEYVWWNGTTWIFYTVDAIGDVGQYCSLAVDSKDYTHFSYYDNSRPFGLKYAKWRGRDLGLDVDTIDSGIYVGLDTSIAVDSNDFPHISFYDVYHNNNSLRYATFNGKYWIFESVDWGQKVGQGSSIAIDSFDQPHITYHDASTRSIKYAYRTNGEWNIETVDTGNFASRTSLALDSSNAPHITYVDNGEKIIKYAHKSHGVWEVQNISSGFYSTIDVSPEDTPQILYVNNGLHLATPRMEITSPLAHQILYRGSSYELTWKTFAVEEFNKKMGKYVSIEVLNDSNNTPFMVVSNTTNDGHYIWDLPQELTPGQYQLKISDLSNDNRYVTILVSIEDNTGQTLFNILMITIIIIISVILVTYVLNKRKKSRKNKQDASR
jgi:hypothetical protein